MKLYPSTWKTKAGRKYRLLRTISGLLIVIGCFWFLHLTSWPHLAAVCLIVVGTALSNYSQIKEEILENKLALKGGAK